MAEKKFYWTKLRTDFFEKDEIDFLMSQTNGPLYVLLYLMLCCFTANSNGELATKVGNMIIPYDVKKISRKSKYFDTDTVIVALEAFKSLGLISLKDDNSNTYMINNFNEMVGSETASAKRVRAYRKKKALQCNNDVTQENRDKILENREEKEELDLHTYECHLLKKEKDSFCLNCQKKNVCNKPTSNGFKMIYGNTFEDHLNRDEKEIDLDILDYDWLGEEEES